MSYYLPPPIPTTVDSQHFLSIEFMYLSGVQVVIGIQCFLHFGAGLAQVQHMYQQDFIQASPICAYHYYYVTYQQFIALNYYLDHHRIQRCFKINYLGFNFVLLEI